MTIKPSILSGQERVFPVTEFIVSKTDPKGLITYVNDVFLKVSDYRIEDLMGKPHNIIRHPAMPRCIFRLLWERLKSGNEIFAYVINRTKFGDYYWVLAHVTPSYDADSALLGYHSNRRSPNQESIKKIQPLYSKLREMEDKAPSPLEGTKASYAALQDWVEKNGGNYDELVHKI